MFPRPKHYIRAIIYAKRRNLTIPLPMISMTTTARVHVMLSSMAGTVRATAVGIRILLAGEVCEVVVDAKHADSRPEFATAKRYHMLSNMAGHELSLMHRSSSKNQLNQVVAILIAGDCRNPS